MRLSNKLYCIPYCYGCLLLTPLVLCAENTASSDQTDSTAGNEKTYQISDEVHDRELSAEEDPLAQHQRNLIETLEEIIAEPDEFRFYGSIRIRYRDTDTESFWGDGGSRFGISGRWQFKPERWLFAGGEAGFNLLDTADLLFNRGDRPPGASLGDEIFRRLLFVGVETPDIMLTVGKNWSTYYRVTSFTDRFQGTGASASGTFNADTDGGNTGTGRADDVFQARGVLNMFRATSILKPLNLNFQIQHGQPIPKVPGKNYNTTIGLSSVLANDQGLAFGLAYNHADIDSADLSELRASGIDGDATALALGARWYGDDWYIGTVLSRLRNHETTTQDIYFDGTGWEVYGQYRVYKNWWTVGGWNVLEPDSGEKQAGDYNVRYGVVGVRYSFRGFSQMIFANARLESSTTQNGLKIGNVYTIGVRWDLP